MKITVTERDRDKGRLGPRSGFTCPVARAIARVMSDARGAPVVNVKPTRVNVNQHTYPLPEAARDWIAAFDADQPVPIPFTFNLDTTKEV